MPRLVSIYAESTGVIGVSEMRLVLDKPSSKRDADPCQRQLLGPSVLANKRWHRFQPVFWSPANLLLPRRSPQLASLLQMLPLWSCYQFDVLDSMPMRLAALLSLVLLSPGVVYAHDSRKARASDKSQDVASTKALRLVPQGATVTDTSCKKLNYVFQARWRCTVTYSD